MFKIIPEFPHYQINENGEVYSLIKCTMVNPRVQHNKPVVTLYQGGKRRVKRLIDLMLATWFDGETKDYTLIDGEPFNVSIHNISLNKNKHNIVMYYGPDRQIKINKIGEAVKQCQATRNALKRNLLFNNHCYKIEDFRYTLDNNNELVALINSKRLNEIIDMEGVIDDEVF